MVTLTRKGSDRDDAPRSYEDLPLPLREGKGKGEFVQGEGEAKWYLHGLFA
jgi:hypothetical protein